MMRRLLDHLADRLPPRWRWLLGGDAMLHQRDLQRIAPRNPQFGAHPGRGTSC